MAKCWTTRRDGTPKAPLGKVRYLTVHVTATLEHLDISADQISAMDMARADLGFQAAYHDVITLDGGVYNTVDHACMGAHVGGHNTGNIGVSIVGGLDAQTKQPKDTRTPAQKLALRNYILSWQKRVPDLIVKGHRDWSPDANHDGIIEPYEWLKACPCFDVAAWINAGMPV